MGKQRRRKRRSFSPEFKAETVRLVQGSEKSLGTIARELDLTETALRAWVRQAEVDAGRASRSRRVVWGRLRRLTPAKPSARMSRAIRLRPTCTPSAASSAWTRRSPKVPRDRVWMTRICSMSAASAVARADAGRMAHA